MHNKTEDLFSLLAKAGASWEGLGVDPTLPTPYSRATQDESPSTIWFSRIKLSKEPLDRFF